MTTIAPDAIKLKALEEDVRRAWDAYRERLRDLSGDEYTSAEGESWADLQQELGRLQERRRLLTPEAL